MTLLKSFEKVEHSERSIVYFNTFLLPTYVRPSYDTYGEQLKKKKVIQRNFICQ